MELIKFANEKISDVLRDKFDGAKMRSRAKYGGNAVLLFSSQRKTERGEINHQRVVGLWKSNTRDVQHS